MFTHTHYLEPRSEALQQLQISHV